ncbi:hypothetical protein BV22DRAFT_1131202 [Leucogyrophana mollusca]|uniref:Uncharacterized protein n=1 Tax=Leucogyrophana mollusca TaxID=85980 RepID=A0ACB8BBZ2_9AGAM|nr:hypothetical protein BV22DRAFT_1131202 [Leucogyrophana mollusca]
MLGRPVLSAFVAAILAVATNAQYECSSIPLCCQQVIDGPVATSSVSSLTTSLGISSAQVIFPVGISCVPIMDPPAEYILLCESPNKQVCCETNNWGALTITFHPMARDEARPTGGKIAFGCFPDPPIDIAK